MTTNKQKRAEDPRCPACENEKNHLKTRTNVPSFFRDMSCGHNNSGYSKGHSMEMYKFTNYVTNCRNYKNNVKNIKKFIRVLKYFILGTMGSMI